MTDDDQRGIRARQADAAPTEVVETRVTPGTVRLRPGTAQAFSWTRLGVVLAIAVLLAAAAYIAQTPLAAGDASASDDPGPTGSEVAESSVPLSPLASAPAPTIGEPEPTEPTDGATPEPTAEVADPTPEGPAWTPRIWSFDPDARFEASVELTEACLLSIDGWEAPHAQVMFQITWDGEVPLALIDYVTDGAGEGGYGGDLAVSGTFGQGTIATTGEPHIETTRFYADTQEIGPGTIVKEIVDPVRGRPDRTLLLSRGRAPPFRCGAIIGARRGARPISR